MNKDLNYAFAVTRQWLHIAGVWPDPFTPFSDIQRINIRFIIVTCILCFYVFLPQLTNTIRAWGNMIKLVEHASSANFSFLALCKLITTWYYGKTLHTLMMSIVNDWITTKNEEKRNIMINLAKQGRTLSARCYITMMMTVLCYLYFNILKLYRSTYQPQRSLVYHFTLYPFNIQKSPNYEIVFCIQLVGGICTAMTNSSVDSFISIILLHICAQLKNLRSSLNNLVDKVSEGSISSSRFKNDLVAITMRHEHLIRNAQAVDNCYSIALFIHMLAATFQLCFQCFQIFLIVTNHFNVPIFKMGFISFYITVVLTHLYIYCYSAERLLIESTYMGYGVYECKWYDISSKDAKNLMFMIYRSTIPLRLTAGKFGTFSLEMFGTTVKTSMGYLSALLTMMD